jgi:hypothetical protein
MITDSIRNTPNLEFKHQKQQNGRLEYWSTGVMEHWKTAASTREAGKMLCPLYLLGFH